jgi:hypothetical protein
VLEVISNRCCNSLLTHAHPRGSSNRLDFAALAAAGDGVDRGIGSPGVVAVSKQGVHTSQTQRAAAGARLADLDPALN